MIGTTTIKLVSFSLSVPGDVARDWRTTSNLSLSKVKVINLMEIGGYIRNVFQALARVASTLYRNA